MKKKKKKKKKNVEKVFRFRDKCIRKCCNKLPFLTREYLLSEVNGLTNRPKIFDITERGFSNLNCLHRDQ